jgi:Tol biopolymer transport system component/TolB-like protein
MLYRNDLAISLAPKVIETLLVLIERPGEILSKREMMKRLWADSFVEDANLTQNIYLLRKTLGKGADGRDLIETFRRRGYRFTGEIRSAPVIADGPKTETFTPSPADPESREQPNAFDSLAVLPFKNESRDEAAEYLSDGVTESIINRLSQLEDFRVVARNTVFRYKTSDRDPQRIGRELSVSAILTGRVLQFGEKLIVRTELVDAASGWQIWGEQYDWRLADVLELQETIAREISEKLELKLSGEERRRLAKRDTKSSEAYSFYVKGRYFLNKRLTETIEQATGFFQKAIDLDPTYALAHVGLADCYPLLSLYGRLTPREAYPKAETAARKALELDDKLAAAYNSLGVVKLFYEWDWTGAEDAFRKAIALNPNYPDAHQRYGMFLTTQERFDESAAEFEKAIRLDPLSLIIKTISGYPFYYARRFDAAAARFGEVIELDELYSMAHFRLGLTRAAEGKYREALAELEKSVDLSNDRDTIAALGYVEGLAGNSATVETVLAELEEREKTGFVTSYNHVLLELGLKNYEAALDWLEKAYRERSYWLIYLKVDPPLDPLRAEKRFVDLEKKIFPGGPAETRETANLPDPGRPAVPAASRTGWWNPWYLVAFLSVAAIVLLGFMLFDRRENRAPRFPSGVNLSLRRLTPNLTTFNPAISPDGESVAYARLDEKGRTALWFRNVRTGDARQLLAPQVKGYLALQFSPDGQQIYYLSYKNEPSHKLAVVDIESGATREVLEHVSVSFAISPDGRQVAFVRDTDLIVAATDGSQNERVISRRDGKSKWFFTQDAQPAWSPDGGRIALSGGYKEQNREFSELVEINVGDGAEKRLPTPPWDKINSVAWGRTDSGLFVIAREEPNQPTQIFYLSPESGAAQKITGDLHNYNSLSLTADSRFLVTEQAAGKSDIWLSEKDDPAQIRQITFDDEENTGQSGLAFMRDGRIVYTSPRSGNIDLWIMNPDGSGRKQLTSNLGGWNIRPHPTPDGRYIVFQSFYNNQNHIWRMDADGRNLIQLTNGDARHSMPDISPDGQWVYYTLAVGEELSLWKISINGGSPIRVSGDEQLTSPAVSPDGKLIAAHYEWDAKSSSKVAILSDETGKRLKSIDLAASRRLLSWTPDSKSLIYIQKNSPDLWEQPIDGAAPRRLTNFSLEQTWNFAFSSDHRQVALSRGNINTETVLINLP